MSPLGRRAAGLLLALCAGAAAGCATARFKVETPSDGTHHLTCATSLPECLEEAERLCRGAHYIVLRAVDEHDHRGGPELNLDVRTSAAIVRCGPPIAWPPGTDPMALAAPTCPAPAASPAPPPTPAPVAPSFVPITAAPMWACVPGATQPCTGAGGCAGGQACRDDGAAFGACDCGAGATGLGRTR
jgi:hypothetical protein